MSAQDLKREAPRIVRVPPTDPSTERRGARAVGALIAVLLLAAGLALLIPDVLARVVVASMLGFAAVAVACGWWYASRRSKRRWVEFMGGFPAHWADDLLAHQTYLTWTGTSGVETFSGFKGRPAADRRRAMQRVSHRRNWSVQHLSSNMRRLRLELPYIVERFAADEARAVVVCIGMVTAPDVGERFFEPEIISATRLLGKQLWFAVLALALLMFWVLQLAYHLLPGRVNLAPFSYVFSMGLLVSIRWFWRSMVHPTYVRMAPGIIEILQYRLGSKRAVVRSYPMTAGTIALVTKAGRGISIYLQRGELMDDLPIEQVRDAAATTERAWAALLSTAPIPTMSDEELIG